MASVPPPTGRSSRRSFQFKKEASLPDLPRFEAVAADSGNAAEPPQEDPGIVQLTAATETPPQDEGVEVKATTETPPQAEGVEVKAPKAPAARPDRKPAKDKNEPTTKPRQRPLKDTASAPAEEETHTEILIRLRFEEGVKEKAQDCCEATGATLADLARLARRNMEVTDDDFSAAPLWPGTVHTFPKSETHRVRLKVRTAMLARWSRKLDPLGLRQPGEIAFNAVQNAFNRTARNIITELMKTR